MAFLGFKSKADIIQEESVKLYDMMETESYRGFDPEIGNFIESHKDSVVRDEIVKNSNLYIGAKFEDIPGPFHSGEAFKKHYDFVTHLHFYRHIDKVIASLDEAATARKNLSSMVCDPYGAYNSELRSRAQALLQSSDDELAKMAEQIGNVASTLRRHPGPPKVFTSIQRYLDALCEYGRVCDVLPACLWALADKSPLLHRDFEIVRNAYDLVFGGARFDKSNVEKFVHPCTIDYWLSEFYAQERIGSSEFKQSMPKLIFEDMFDLSFKQIYWEAFPGDARYSEEEIGYLARFASGLCLLGYHEYEHILLGKMYTEGMLTHSIAGNAYARYVDLNRKS